MRLIDADTLQARIMEYVPGFLDGGSEITKAFILAMISTKSVTPTIDAVQVTRCKNCKWYSEETSWCNNLMQPKEPTFFCKDGRRSNE